MSNELLARNEQMPANNVATPATLLELAINKGADIDQLEKLMALQERYDAKQAKSMFLLAMTEFQSIVPRITKSKTGHNFSYAPLADIVEQIKSSMQKCGLSFRFEQNHENGIEVTCVVSHIEGHCEKTTMKAGADKSGSKNDVQAVGSTVQYLQRYTLTGALGLTTADEDIDGRLPHESIESGQVETIKILLADCEAEFKGFRNAFLKWLNQSMKCESIDQIRKDRFNDVVKKINESLEVRRKA